MLLISLVVLFLLLGLSLSVAAALFTLGYFLDVFFAPPELTRALGHLVWDTSTNFILISIPLFVMTGEILMRSGIATRLYDALNSWVSWLPGGLLHANIGSATLFSATSGSSVATAATIGTIALPQGRRFGYDERWFAGSIAAGGTLGILIPPSINLIIYGFLSQTSIPQLFLAGIVPGLMLAFLFILTIIVLVLIRPEWGGQRESYPWSVRFRNLVHLIPVGILFAFIVGSIYTGWATPTEAAAIGVLVALILAACYGGLSFDMIVKVLEGTMRTTGIIMLILFAAGFLNFALASVGLTNQLFTMIAGFDLTPMQTLFLLVLFYIVLGLFIETLSLMIITIPLVVPLIVGLGFDKVWFGILLIVLIEMALITPPVGMNLYVVQSVRGRGTLTDVMVGAAPFVVALLLLALALIAFPQLALFIPQTMSN